uniref:F-box domain-containing protein n=1 Tax=Panagrellus redivivus TaxID=6233 RepID=A0A7E4ZXE3_PANRE
MPFPIAKLPYGLRCRLSELSTPVERYNLQIAAGNLFICPPKLQYIQIIKALNFDCSDEEITVDSIPPTDKQTDYIKDDSLTSCTEVTFTKAHEYHLSSDIFGHFLMQPKKLCLNKCDTGKPFIEKVSAMTSTDVFDVMILGDTNSQTISITDVLTGFPKLESILFHDICVAPTWMDDIMRFNGNESPLREVLMSMVIVDFADEIRVDTTPITIDDGMVFTVAVGDEALFHEHAHVTAMAVPDMIDCFADVGEGCDRANWAATVDAIVAGGH